MKNILIFLMLFVTTIAVAQPPRGRDDDRKEARERIDAMAVAYITDELQLTKEEAQKFWPVFNELRETRIKLERNKRKLIKEMEDSYEAMTDEQAQVYIDKLEAIEQQLAKAGYQKNSKQIVAIIGAKRFLKLIKTEEDFRRKMLKEFRKRRDNKN